MTVKTLRIGVTALLALSSVARSAAAQEVYEFEDHTRHIQAATSNSFVAVRSPEQNQYSALSLTRGTGKWKTYTAAPETKLTAIASEEILATAQEGPGAREIAVFEPNRDEWKIQVLPEPAKHAVCPHIVKDVAVYVIGKHLYAFRGKGMSWSTRDLPNEDAPVVLEIPSAVLVQQGKTLVVYSTITGTWSDAVVAEPAVEVRGAFGSVGPSVP